MFCVRAFIYLLVVATLFGCGGPIQKMRQEKQQRADFHYKLGAAHLRGNNPSMALKELLEAVKNDPKNSAIHVTLANAYQMKKAYLLAEEHYLQAIKLSDDDPRYQNNLASLYLDMELWDKAIIYFDLAAVNLLFANSHVALSGKGFALFKKQQYRSALVEYDKALELVPRYASAYLRKSETYQAMGETEQARDALEKAIAIAPNYARALYQLGIIQLQERQVPAAIEKFKRVVELIPNSDLALESAELLRSIDKTGGEQN